MKVTNNIPVLDGARFSWKGNAGSAEASDLNVPWPFAQQVWDDACDVGFYVESHITGFRKLFLLTFVQKDHEGDVQHWIYQEYLQPGHVKPGTLITLTIFND